MSFPLRSGMTEEVYNRNIMRNLITEELRGFKIKLMTKPGIFSSKKIDSGSRLLIDNLEVKDGTMICDLGTGSGIIGIICAKLNLTGHVHLLEDHLSSSELAKNNIELNGLKNAEVFLSDLFSAVEERNYNLIVSNPPQHLGNDFLDEAAKECFKHLRLGGEVYWVIQKHVKPFIAKLFEKCFMNVATVAMGGDYVVLKAKK